MVINRGGFDEMAQWCGVQDEEEWAKTEPWGTPQDSGRGCEQWLEALTENDLEDKYDWNQSRAVLETPNQEDSRWRRMV